MEELNGVLAKRVITVEGPATVRAVVRQQGAKTIVHLLNLDVQRISSFEDRVKPATQVRIRVRCGKAQPTKVRVRSADDHGTRGAVPMAVTADGGEFVAELTVPRVEVSAIVVIEAL
jgi:hypothetical protein